MEAFANWEALCRRCGRCCYEKIEQHDAIYYTDVPCEKLDLVTRRCTVYTSREQARPGCRRLTPILVRRGLLPADCPYVAGIKNYVAPVLIEKT